MLQVMPRSTALVLGFVAWMTGCGGAVASDGGKPSPTDPAPVASPGQPQPAPPAQPAGPPIDYSIVPLNVAEARRQCASPPTDWEPTPSPTQADYLGHWVMCSRPTASGDLVPTTSWHILLIADDSYVVEGYPYELWDWGLVIPDKRVLVMPFRADDANGYGIARGTPQRARGGFAHWLRLPVDPSESGLLAPLLHGMTEAIWVRVQHP
jgi:hypothetical protein